MQQLKTPKYKKITVSRIYRDANSTILSPDDFEKFEVCFGDIEKYEISHPIGHGKYSIVFLGRCCETGEMCAIKVLKNMEFFRIQRELFFLSMVNNIPSIVSLKDVLKDPLTNAISIVTDFQDTELPKTLYPKLTLVEIRNLIYKLLKSLDETAKKCIIHRDVKPGNIMISSDHKNLQLIDWGLAEIYCPKKAYPVRVSTLRYKAPELLLNYQYYDYGLDVWVAGCVLAEMLIRFPFFTGNNIGDMIAQISSLWGLKIINQYINKFSLELPQSAIHLLPNNQNDTWDTFTKMISPDKYDEKAIDLLRKLLTVDHEDRITASEAINHCFFNSMQK